MDNARLNVARLNSLLHLFLRECAKLILDSLNHHKDVVVTTNIQVWNSHAHTDIFLEQNILTLWCGENPMMVVVCSEWRFHLSQSEECKAVSQYPAHWSRSPIVQKILFRLKLRHLHCSCPEVMCWPDARYLPYISQMNSDTLHNCPSRACASQEWTVYWRFMCSYPKNWLPGLEVPWENRFTLEFISSTIPVSEWTTWTIPMSSSSIACMRRC